MIKNFKEKMDLLNAYDLSEQQRDKAGHLILTMKPGAIVRIGYGDSLVDLELVEIKGSRVKVAFTAAKSVPIMRVASVKKCRHGNQVAECNECCIESDLAFDAQREGR